MSLDGWRADFGKRRKILHQMNMKNIKTERKNEVTISGLHFL